MENPRAEVREIVHDSDNKRFHFIVAENQDAEITYEFDKADGETIIDFNSTYVPAANRNTGLGTKLAETAVRFAIANDYKVKASCPFVQDYMESRADYKELMVG